MGSDRARISYDPSRHWRGVISQQGRVTIEADWNEAAAIAAEERREELVDIIGPAGTPDGGYQILPGASGSPPGDLMIQHGTLYVGGERMVLDSDLTTRNSPTGSTPRATRCGPRRGARCRHYRGRLPAAARAGGRRGRGSGAAGRGARRARHGGALAHPPARQCARRPVPPTAHGATTALEQFWAAKGLQLDPATMRLESLATLQVSFQQQPQPPSRASRSAQGGYLGARTSSSGCRWRASTTSGVPTLVWGFDNAYFLYRIASRPSSTRPLARRR